MYKYIIIFLMIIISVTISATSDYEVAYVKKVIDGDTIILTTGEKVRLIGINTPERGDKYYEEATEFVKKIFIDSNKIYLVKDVSNTDRYNRLLRYVWIQLPNNIKSPTEDEIRRYMLNAIILLSGYAETMNIKPDTKYKYIFKILEKDKSIVD